METTTKGEVNKSRNCDRIAIACDFHVRLLFSCLRRVAFFLILALPLFPFSGRSQTAEYKLKAVFLFNFAQFVEWPADSFPDETSPLVIGILGDDPFGSFLDELVENEIVHNRQVKVRRYRNIGEVEHCQVLFISPSEAGQLSTIVQRLGNRPILSVSDIEEFARRGGIVRFVTEKNKIRFRINLEAAQAARINISSKLLRVAEVIGTQKER